MWSSYFGTDAFQCVGNMENWRSPKPSNSRVNNVSPAISPQTTIGTWAWFALRIMCATNRNTAGCSGSYRCATVSSVRSIASVYWIKSLVPIDKKSSLCIKISRHSAAAGISIMPPIWMPASNGTLSSCKLSFARSIRRSVWLISETLESIGTKIRTWP